jgi:SNF2 family DNA or RNA helicase
MLTENNAPVIITSYGTLRQDIELLAETFFDVVVIDESHHIKNPSTKISRAVHRIKSHYTYCA